jgi:hypothetical protein
MNKIRRLLDGQDLDYITFPEYCPSEGISKEQAKGIAKKNRWEGFVVVDPEQKGYGDKSYNFHGKPERPKYCGKLKPMLEADFIVRWDADNGIGLWGKGKKQNGVGSVFCYLWDPAKEEEVYIGKCGGGLKTVEPGIENGNVFDLADPSLYPLVWEVEFTTWTPKGSFQFPEFVRLRTDKTPEECTIDQRITIE